MTLWTPTSDGLVDLTFRALGPEVLAMAWPAFLAFAVGQIAFVAYVRRRGPPDLVWSVAALMTALMTFAALGIASERAWVQFIAREGLQPSSQTVWERLLNVIRWSTGPTLWIFAICQVLLPIRPRSQLARCHADGCLGDGPELGDCDLVISAAAYRNLAAPFSPAPHVGYCGVRSGFCGVQRFVGEYDSPRIARVTRRCGAPLCR